MKALHSVAQIAFIAVLACCTVTTSFAAADPGFNRAVSTYLRDDYEQALPLFRGIVKNDPNNAMAHYYLALCHIRLGDKDNGAKEYLWVIDNTKDAALKEIVQARLLRIRPELASKINYKPTVKTAVKPGPVSQVIFFSTSWCPTCRSFEPTWEKARVKFAKKIKFEHLNAEDAGNWTSVAKYLPKAYPTLVYLDASGNVIENGPGAPVGPAFASHLMQLGAKK